MLVAIPVSVLIINYSTFGKKVSTTGLSTSASTYAGINIQKKRMIAMIISGLLAGLLGAMIYCGQTNQVFVTISAKAIPSEGFNGISVGLIAMTNPIGVLPISLFFAMVDNAKATIQSAYSVDPAIADLMFGVIVYGAAAISLIYYFKP
jgi:simple sugar transport system permease protein